MRRACASSRGISLLEVIVALVVLSTFGAALFGWAAQTHRTAVRSGEILRRLELERNAIEVASSLNPARTARGRIAFGSTVVEWDSTPLRALVDHVRHPSGISPYQVGLYEVRIRVISEEPGMPPLMHRQIVAGHVQARPRSSGPPGFSEAGSR